MIQEGNELAGCEFQTFVSCNCYAGVRGQASEHYTTIAPLEIFGPAGEGGIARSIIDKAKLPILVHLVEDRLNAGVQKTQGCFVERGHYADEGLVGKGEGVFLHAFPHRGGKSIECNPDVVGTL